MLDIKAHSLKVFGAAILGWALVSPAVAQQPVLKVGVVATLTGPAAAWGQAMSAGAQLAAKQVNDQNGLLVGGTRYRVEVIPYDEQYKAGVAMSAIQRLINQDNVRFIIGPLASSSALAVRDLLQESKVIAISTGTSRKALDAKAPYLLRMLSTPVEYSQPMVRWLTQNIPADVRRVVIFNPNDESGWDSRDVLTSGYTEAGFTVAGTELFERSLRDFQPILTKLLAEKPDIIELGTTPPATSGLLIRQAREMGYKGRFVKIGGPGLREIVDTAGREAAEGMITYMNTNTLNPEYQKMSAEFKKAQGHEMNDLLPLAYDSTRILFAAIQKAGSTTDTEAVLRAIPEVMPFKSALGESITLGGKQAYGIDRQLLFPNFVGVIRSGTISKLDELK